MIRQQALWYPLISAILLIRYLNLSDSDSKLTLLPLTPFVIHLTSITLFWKKIAGTIELNYDKYDGFVILHGTDTMSYSASALSFMLENLGKPVVFTGSQLPIGMLRTDGKENLITAIEIAGAYKDNEPVVPEVSLYFDNRLFRGNRTTKISTEHFDAFGSPNYPPLAEVGLHIRYNYNYINYPTIRKDLIVNKEIDNNVSILKLYPGISRSAVNAILSGKGLKAVVLETFGSGNAPTASWFLEEIGLFIASGGIILNVTQCLSGSVEMAMYKTGLELLNAGVLSGRDMTTESAVTKLMYLTSGIFERDKILENIRKPLRGEIS